MTEQFEVIELQEELQYIIEEFRYEAAIPGEVSEIEALFIASMESIQEAINLLNKVLRIMENK
jgi:hypothetical protein